MTFDASWTSDGRTGPGKFVGFQTIREGDLTVFPRPPRLPLLELGVGNFLRDVRHKRKKCAVYASPAMFNDRCQKGMQAVDKRGALDI